jgi:hypothetical protein
LPWAYQSSGFPGKTHQTGLRRPEQIERGTKRYKGLLVDGATRDPTEGTRHSSSFVSESGQGGFHHPSLGGLEPSRLGSPDREYLGTMRETTRPEFVSEGEGHLPPSSLMERYICP